MVARILIINDYKHDISGIVEKLKLSYNSLLFLQSTKDELNADDIRLIDVILISLPSSRTMLSSNFFHFLRRLRQIIPIIGIIAEEDTAEQFFDIGMDDFVSINIDKSSLLRKIETLALIRMQFDDYWLNEKLFIEKSQKICAIFFDNLNFMCGFVGNSLTIERFESLLEINDADDFDLFLINIKSVEEACECCSTLRIKPPNRRKPIVFAYDKSHENVARRIMKQFPNVGYTDIINTDMNSAIIVSKLNSFIKYKKMYETFSEKAKKNAFLAATDPITGVHSRIFFEDFIKSHNDNLRRSAVVLIDIDSFKRINDRCGHIVADSVLKLIIDIVKKCIRATDLIFRYGGDEFVIFMNGVSNETATSIATRIRKTIKNELSKNVGCTVSVGLCYIDANENLQFREAVAKADALMYAAKHCGGNAVCVYP